MTCFIVLQCHIGDKTVMGRLLLSSGRVRLSPCLGESCTGHCKGRHCKFTLTAVMDKPLLGPFHQRISSQFSTDLQREYGNRKLFLMMYSQRIEGPVLALPIFVVLDRFLLNSEGMS